MNERRYLPLADLEIRSADGKPPVIRGYASVFNSLSEDLGGFREIIKPGAFRAALDNGDDVIATVDHDPGKLLARRSAGTLYLAEDSRGLRFELTPPDTSYGRDLIESMRRGDIRSASFGFRPSTAVKSWRTAENGDRIREMRSLQLFEVAVVTNPAYPDAAAALRSLSEYSELVERPLATARAKLRLRAAAI